MAAESRTTFAVIYRFTVATEDEHEFVEAWTELTKLIRTHRGSRGSRLHRADDGTFYAYAQWPDRSSWQNDRDMPAEASKWLAAMERLTAGPAQVMPMQVVCDLLEPEPNTPSVAPEQEETL